MGKHVDLGWLFFFPALAVLSWVFQFLYKRKAHAEEIARRQEFSVWIDDEAVHCSRRNEATECVPIADLAKVSVETNDSGPWGYDVWFILDGKQGNCLAFPLEASGQEEVLACLKKLPGFELRGMNSTENATFECWPNPSAMLLMRGDKEHKEEMAVRFSRWAVASTAIAAVAFCYGPLRQIIYAFSGSNGVPSSNAIAYSIWLGWLWIASLIVVIAKDRWRSVSLIAVAPLALYWPAMWIFKGHACDLLGRCHSLFGLISNGP